MENFYKPQGLVIGLGHNFRVGATKIFKILYGATYALTELFVFLLDHEYTPCFLVWFRRVSIFH